ncbi:sugar transferase [Puniceicoccus vermicola]|uniref:Sugar transferase n=1 Tax=Puniceicoccus vermicola TaxID=388746 RepID=A0A7X1E3M1_9BACT|nr:sugar transferase [Puniceicoccus vermicola]MBC2601206.1 sugar transferase [Puniceicoccus vermicola]
MSKLTHFLRSVLAGPLALAFLDYCIAYVAIIVALKLAPKFRVDILEGIAPNTQLFSFWFVLPVLTVIGAHISGLHNHLQIRSRLRIIALSAITPVIGLIFFGVFFAIVQFELLGRVVSGLYWLLAFGGIAFSRLFAWSYQSGAIHRIMVFGEQSNYFSMQNRLYATRLPLRVVGFTNTKRNAEGGSYEDEGKTGFLRPADMPLAEFFEKMEVDEVLVDTPHELSEGDRDGLMTCMARGIRVMNLNYFFERRLLQVFSSNLSENWFWSQDPVYFHPFFFAAKRAVDLFLSLCGLLCLVPVFPFLALAIKLQDGGPIFYRQTRCGQYNQPFTIYKLRTMRQDAEKDGAAWAQKGDCRVTRLGRFLRKTRFDETPQFWNVLKGDMSFIGPRPERPEMIDEIEEEVPNYSYRHLVKPGITGWAQINYGYGASIADARKKLDYDLYYLKYASVVLEIQILLGTVVAMVKGAR